MERIKHLLLSCSLFCIVASNAAGVRRTLSLRSEVSARTSRKAPDKFPTGKPDCLSADLRTFGLRGPVKSCVYTHGQQEQFDRYGDNVIVTNRGLERLGYDRKGRLVQLDNWRIIYRDDDSSSALYQSVYGWEEPYYYNRDEEGGQLLNVVCWMHGYVFIYDILGNVADLAKGGDGSWYAFDRVAVRNESSWPETVCVVNGDYGEETPTFKGKITYKYIRADHHGNWTERVATLTGRYTDELTNKTHKVRITYTDCREITYYEEITPEQ